MKELHNFLCRLFFYTLALMFLNTAFGSWPDSPHVGFYLINYGISGVLYVALFEGAYRVATARRLRK
jgi:hypothetical protein